MYSDAAFLTLKTCRQKIGSCVFYVERNIYFGNWDAYVVFCIRRYLHLFRSAVSQIRTYEDGRRHRVAAEWTFGSLLSQTPPFADLQHNDMFLCVCIHGFWRIKYICAAQRVRNIVNTGGSVDVGWKILDSSNSDSYFMMDSVGFHFQFRVTDCFPKGTLYKPRWKVTKVTGMALDTVLSGGDFWRRLMLVMAFRVWPTLLKMWTRLLPTVLYFYVGHGNEILLQVLSSKPKSCGHIMLLNAYSKHEALHQSPIEKCAFLVVGLTMSGGLSFYQFRYQRLLSIISPKK